jgi:ubiquinone/menaquinone biosynthesis C-methylase UbiE
VKIYRMLAGLLLCAASWAQVATQANSGYTTPKGRENVANSLVSPNREKALRPKELVDHMGLQPGNVVADVGTGAGVMLPALSEAVGSSGKVLAEDIFDDFLAKARDRAKGLTNVSYIKGTETDPKLPANGVDQILVLDVYHHFDYPEKMLAAFHKALRPGGKLVIVEYYKRPNAMPDGRAMTHIRLDEADVIKEIEANRFRLASKREHTKDSQYMLVLEKK